MEKLGGTKKHWGRTMNAGLGHPIDDRKDPLEFLEIFSPNVKSDSNSEEDKTPRESGNSPQKHNNMDGETRITESSHNRNGERYNDT